MKNYFDFIRSQYCYFQMVVIQDADYPRGCNQAWDDQLGQPISEVSHILRRRSMRLKEGENHFGNVMSNCNRHHQWFEALPPEEREKYKDVGQMYLDLFNDR